MDPTPDHGEHSYKGAGRLRRRAIITGGDSGIGRAVAIAYAREGANLLIAYLNEDEDAKATAALVEAEEQGHPRARRPPACSALRGGGRAGRFRAGRRRHPCRQRRAPGSFKKLEDISNEEWS